MTIETLSPQPKLKFFDNNGDPADRYRIFSYRAGTTTKLSTYTDAAGGTPNSNPVTLNYRGECDLWIPPNVAYKYVFAPPGTDDPPTSSIWTVDNIVNSQLITLYGGVDAGSANAYTLTFISNFAAYSDGIVIYWVAANNNTGPSTLNVNGLGVIQIVNPDGSALGANQIQTNQMTQVIYRGGKWQLLSISGFVGPLIGTFGASTTIAAAATTDLGSAIAHVANITGGATITSFGNSASLIAPIYIVYVKNSGVTISYNSVSLITPNLVDYNPTINSALIAQVFNTVAGVNYWRVYPFSNTEAGTFNGVFTGMTAAVGVVVNYEKIGNIVSLWTSNPYIGTSNATSMTITGLPASITPSSGSRHIKCARMTDNSNTLSGICQVAFGSPTGTLNFALSNTATIANRITEDFTAFTNIGNKGLQDGWSITYPIK